MPFLSSVPVGPVPGDVLSRAEYIDGITGFISHTIHEGCLHPCGRIVRRTPISFVRKHVGKWMLRRIEVGIALKRVRVGEATYI